MKGIFALLSETVIPSAGVIAAYIYIVSLGLPFYSHIPLFILSVVGFVAALFAFRKKYAVSPLTYPLMFFMGSMVLSCFVSSDIEKSILLSLSFIPAILLFFLMAEVFDTRQIRVLYIIFSCLGLIISLISLWAALKNKGGDSSCWIRNMGNPNIIVPNDLILLVVFVPFSLAIVKSESHITFKVLSMLSILSSLCVITIYQSRGALLLIFVSFFCMMILLKSSVYLIISIIMVVAVFVVDMIHGFPLASKFAGVWDTRLLYWLVAWSLFMDAPLLGHGPRTYGLLYNTYKNQIEAPDWLNIDPRFTPWAHNLYLETMSEQGILGLASLTVLFGCGLKIAWNLCKSEQKEISVSGSGACAGLVIITLASLFELSFIRRWVVIMLFSVLGIIISLYYQNQADTRSQTGVENRECPGLVDSLSNQEPGN